MKRAAEPLFSPEQKRAKTQKPCLLNSEDCYQTSWDYSICDSDKNQVIQPLVPGAELIVEYYNLKYACNIHIVSYSHEKGHDFSELYKGRKGSGDFRKVFLLGMHSAHASPLLYIREKGKEALFIADSLGTESPGIWIKNLQDETGLKIWLIRQQRQADVYSCFTDALFFGKELTAMHPKNGDYLIPNFLGFLEKNSVDEIGEAIAVVNKLPERLLKTVQRSSFLEAYRKPDIREVVHHHHNNPEYLDDFRLRYTQKDVEIHRFNLTGFQKSKTDIYSYPRLKGQKFLNIILVMLYLHDAEKHSALFPEDKQEFIRQGLQILKAAVTPVAKERVIADFQETFLQENRASIEDLGFSR